jgi:hypothetical protein
MSKLPEWFDDFLANVCEIPDRNSPEGEPEAIVATLEELKSCALSAIENSKPAECAPREAPPVGPRTTLNYDGTFDTTCAHCGGNGCFACLKSAAPTPERADAGKDAALTDEQIRDIWLRETGFDEQAAPFAILEFARAILAAKEKK